MEQLHKDLMSESLDQRLKERDALVRMLIWAKEEVTSLGGAKSGEHIKRAIDCMRHEL